MELGNASEAYRKSYNASKMKDETIRVKAFELMQGGNITERLDFLRNQAAKRNDVTVDSLMAELEEARQVAMTAPTPQSSAAVAATMGKAKLAGLDKQLVEHSGKITVGIEELLRDII
jgi:hypothetical protein